MTWPTIFANLAGGNQPLSLFDTMFNQVAQMVAIPSTAAGTNAISLTPIGNAPALTNYQNFSSFRFVAVATSTAVVTAQYQSLGFLPVYLADGVTQASTGNILINEEYVLVFIQQLNGGAGGFILEQAAIGAGVSIFAPNVQVFTSGTSLTYTTPTAASKLPLYLRVRMVGGGGGGAAVTTNAGGNGGDTSFAAWTAIHGAGGAVASNGGAGGSGGVNGTGTQISRVSGGNGNAGNASGGGSPAGGMGGVSPFGGAGAGTINAAGTAASANSGSGGGGGSTSTGSGSGGGGAGEFVEFIITTPVASYTYTVGASGAGGAAGGAAGGNGGAGRIEVIAYWQ